MEEFAIQLPSRVIESGQLGSIYCEINSLEGNSFKNVEHFLKAIGISTATLYQHTEWNIFQPVLC